MKNHHIIFGLLLFLLSSYQGKAQTPDSLNIDDMSYEQFKKSAMQDYDNFRRKAHDEYESFIREEWQRFQCFKSGNDAFLSAKPEAVPAIAEASGIISVEAPSADAIPSEESARPTDAIVPMQNSGEESDRISVSFYGCQLEFNLPKSLRIKAKGTRENQVAQYYHAMSQQNGTKAFLAQLDAQVNRMGLNEWGYFALLRCISEKTFSDMNDRVLFCFFMMHSEGFRARVGRGQHSGQLKLLIAIDNSKEIYSMSFFRINGVKYYALYGGEAGEDTYSYGEKADENGLRQVGLDFSRTLNMAACNKNRKLAMPKTGDTLTLPYCTSHLRYYDEMPMTVFPVYFKTGLANETQQLLSAYFGGLSQRYNKVQLVDIMLNFVQTAFDYKIDEKQFGREKYFFPEEVIGYRYSDCEDRAALFGWLVRTYAHCETVGVLYPDHLATAVCFGSQVKIDAAGFDYKGKHYYICDPTYRNAPIGTVMPKLKGKAYEIIEIR